MAHIDSICEQCGCEYNYDEEAAPSFCSVVCSQGCNEAFNKKDTDNDRQTTEDNQK